MDCLICFLQSKKRTRSVTERSGKGAQVTVYWMLRDSRTGKFDADGESRDLHALLAAGGERGPFVMVGHSLGGPYIMNFTRLYPQEVAGLVFVDASHPDQIERMNQAVGKKLEGGEGLFKVANALSWTGIPRLVASHTENNTMPPQAKRADDAYLSRSLAATLTSAGQLRQLGERPIVVLTATKPLPSAALKSLNMTDEQGQKIKTVWTAMHDEEASWSQHSRHELVPDATHYIQFDRPDVVIAAVREVVGSVRSSRN